MGFHYMGMGQMSRFQDILFRNNFKTDPISDTQKTLQSINLNI